ncbi:MAG: hypothetical protein GY756_09205 [bacterium]|nr:hypothetical protein [bacterium]
MITVNQILSTETYKCPKCSGTGEEECTSCHGVGFEKCPKCHGEGKLSFGRECLRCNATGYVMVNCFACDGAGELSCKSCRGTGKVGIFKYIFLISVLILIYLLCSIPLLFGIYALSLNKIGFGYFLFLMIITIGFVTTAKKNNNSYNTEIYGGKNENINSARQRTR